MREVFASQDFTRVGYYKSVLDEAGIPTFIRNEFSNNSVDGLQGPAIYPALCVVIDEDFDEAMKILGEIFYALPTQNPDWKCPKCLAEVPGNFDSCWQCGIFRTAPANS